MTWSIYKDTSYHYNEWQECHTAWFFDHDVTTNNPMNNIRFLHDGLHDVYFDKNYVTCGVTNGLWDPDTEQKILYLVSSTYHGEYIEGFERHDGKIRVLIGS